MKVLDINTRLYFTHSIYKNIRCTKQANHWISILWVVWHRKNAKYMLWMKTWHHGSLLKYTTISVNPKVTAGCQILSSYVWLIYGLITLPHPHVFNKMNVALSERSELAFINQTPGLVSFLSPEFSLSQLEQIY